jgi:hypothetical protein
MLRRAAFHLLQDIVSHSSRPDLTLGAMSCGIAACAVLALKVGLGIA